MVYRFSSRDPIQRLRDILHQLPTPTKWECVREVWQEDLVEPFQAWLRRRFERRTWQVDFLPDGRCVARKSAKRDDPDTFVGLCRAEAIRTARAWSQDEDGRP